VSQGRDIDEDGLRLLTVRGEYEGELEADRVDIHITVRGSALFSGEVGLRTVREVAELVDALKQIGVPETDIKLHSVDTDVHARVVGRSSSATCRLRVRCHNLRMAPTAVLSIRALKQASVDYLEWGYTFSTELQAEWLGLALRQAAVKARKSAEELGVELAGVHRVSEGWAAGPQSSPHVPYSESLDLEVGARHAVAPDVPLSQSKQITVRAEVIYRLAESSNRTTIS
jgi:uncharacterized protein YggE